jgi:hypothetical protein
MHREPPKKKMGRPFPGTPLSYLNLSVAERPYQAPAMTETMKPSEIKPTQVQLAARQHTALDWLRMQAPCAVAKAVSALLPLTGNA